MYKKVLFQLHYLFETVKIQIKQLDPDLVQIEKHDPDQYQSVKQDPDPDQKGLDPLPKPGVCRELWTGFGAGGRGEEIRNSW